MVFLGKILIFDSQRAFRKKISGDWWIFNEKRKLRDNDREMCISASRRVKVSTHTPDPTDWKWILIFLCWKGLQRTFCIHWGNMPWSASDVCHGSRMGEWKHKEIWRPHWATQTLNPPGRDYGKRKTPLSYNSSLKQIMFGVGKRHMVLLRLLGL